MAIFSGEDAVRELLRELDGWVSEPVDVYLLGGTAMTVRGLKERTEDVDLALGVESEFDHVFRALRDQGFEVTGEPTAAFEDVGATLELHQPARGLQIDLFDRQVVGKVWITGRMRDRAERFWTGERATVSVLSDEDMFLLKAVSGGSGRRRDVEDMRTYARRGLAYETVLAEIEEQRPFNTGSTEARLIRERSHPLFAIETAVQMLAGLPSRFEGRVSAFATESEVEYVVLGAVDDGIEDVDSIRDRVRSNVRSLPEGEAGATEAAIARLGRKRILARDGGRVRLLTE